MAPSLSEIAAEHGALRFAGGGDLQGLASSAPAGADEHEAMAEPGMGEGGVQVEGGAEGVPRGGEPAATGLGEPADGVGVGIARRESERLVEGVLRGATAAEAEFERGDTPRRSQSSWSDWLRFSARSNASLSFDCACKTYDSAMSSPVEAVGVPCETGFPLRR